MTDIRKLLPRKLDELGVWEVSRDGHVIGTISERRLRNARNVFFSAVGVHPVTGERVNLELSTDFEDRVRVIEELQDDPGKSRGIHWR